MFRLELDDVLHRWTVAGAAGDHGGAAETIRGACYRSHDAHAS